MNPVCEIIQKQNQQNVNKQMYDWVDCIRKCSDMFEVIYNGAPEYQQNYIKQMYEWADDIKKCTDAFDALNKFLPEYRQMALELGFLLFYCKNATA